MLKIEKVIREYKGEEQQVKFIAGVGNLTADVETREVTTKNGDTTVAGGNKQSIAFNYWEKGEKKSVFFPIEAWSYTAQALGKMGKKGVQVSVIGRLEIREFTTKEGKTYANETLVIESFQVTSHGFEVINNKEGSKKSTTENTDTGVDDMEGFHPFHPDDEDIPF